MARHKEDISWLPRAKGWRPLVITKNIDMPNVGREAASYFLGLSQLYDKLRPKDLIACVQAQPFEHREHLPAPRVTMHQLLNLLDQLIGRRAAARASRAGQGTR